MNRNQIIISNNNQSFIVKKNKFDDCFLIDESDNVVSIFMCLQSPPSFFENKNPSGFHFENRSYNLCLRKCRVSDDEMNEIRVYLKQWSSNVHNIVNVPQNYTNRSLSLTIEDREKFCLIKQWHSNYSSILPPNLSDEIVNKLVSIQSNRELELTLMNNIPKRFKEIEIKEYRTKNESKYEYNSYFKANSNYIKVPSVTITPSRIIYNSMKLIKKNRVHRYYDDPRHFISMNFQSEDGSWNPWHNENVRNFFRDILKNGIPVAERTYTFVGCSNSQLRETDGRCYCSDLNSETVHDRIGDFSDLKISNPGRKLTRIAHAFCSSTETVAVDEKYLKNVEDDIVGGSDGDVTFSDGIGRGSVELFEKISAKLQISPIPTAFQIRVGGIKGVISKFDQKEDLTIRKSMKKFDSDHNIIEVLNFNRLSPVFLNRAMVLILSQLGVPDDVFMNMQKESLNSCIDAITTNANNALKFVNCPLFIDEWTRLGDKIVTEPFFRKILKKQLQMRIFSIANKTKIKVDEGRMLTGILDETGELEYGEVFVQIIEDAEKPPHILDCEILLSRSPCVLPSDLRRLRAKCNVSSRMKKLYNNVVVFPSRGENSHANECAGGDLDGDIYSVIWDKKLIPKNLKPPGREVVSVKIIHKEDKCESNKHITVDDMIDYFCIFHSQNVLGKLANAHLALAELFGIENERTMDLAKILVAETDAPIKGFTVDEDKYKDLLPDKYPHFMKKFDRESFHSKKVLGKMFDEAWTLTQAIKKTSSDEIFPRHYRVASATKSDVDQWYSLYCDEISDLMINLKLNNEVDLFLGLSSSDKNSRDNFKTRKDNAELAEYVLEQFWMKWKVRFEDFKRKSADNKMELMNWYNRPNQSYCPAQSFSLLALPYIKKSETCTDLLANSAETSIRRWIIENKQYFITVWLQDDFIRRQLQHAMNNTCSFIITDISNLAFGNNSPKLHLWTDGDLQIIKSTLLNKKLPKNKRRRKLKEIRLTYQSRSVIITNDTTKLRVISAIANFFDTNKKLWPTLRVLLRWARIVNIIDSWLHGSYPKAFMTTLNFILLFIEHFLGKSLCFENHTKENITQDRLVKWMTFDYSSGTNNHCGNMFLDFLRMLSDSSKKSFILKKRDPNLKIQYLKRNFDEIQRMAKHAMFVFSLYDGRICEIMIDSKVQPVVRNQYRYRPNRINQRKKSSQLARPQNFVPDNFEVKLKFNNNTLFKLSIIFEDEKFCVEVVCTHKRNIKNEESFVKSKTVINAISYENQKNYYVTEYKNFEKFFSVQMTDNENNSKNLVENVESQNMKSHDQVAVPMKNNKTLKGQRKILKRKKPIVVSCFLVRAEVSVNPLKPNQKLKSQFQMNAKNIYIFRNENGFSRYSVGRPWQHEVNIFVTWNSFNLIIAVNRNGKVVHIRVDDQENKTEQTASEAKDIDQLQSQLFDKIICTSEFVRQINDKNLSQQSLNCNCENPVQLSEFNVTLRKISVLKNIASYSNWDHDIMNHSIEFNGTFSDNTKGFEWHPVKKNLTVDINDKSGSHSLSEKTFGVALSLFRLEKKSF